MEALHRVRDTMAITPKIAPKITLKSATVALLRPFSGECCFQVIYFVSNISSSPPAEVSPTDCVETVRLTHAVKNDG
jgi:hypothetical protein